ncbi:4-aminobutyrate--2-oxoglutarate transaminase [Ferrimonas marina]|uniref:4-aminobutyrate aminotransferase / (S)-3-amino-2-methylpropionate transaminase n=1 Tax=Ferrimonas marina TaxID=299255 RepID=A0A1M5X798_9GAMM|nr:4-aminobutyrate--2-oxoglutarate transaminase [Ferrimonas marina]SHH95512.1 4-aminobutyrate aminotransferase / (S)-3-amino-2-methylpropionate transaminase [Ferrimonas marina]
MENQQLQARKQQAMAQGMGNLYPLYVAKADNAEIWDVEGNRYVDFAAGIAVTNTGHLHPKVKAAVSAQLEQFSHTCAMVTPYESMVTLAERLNALTPGESQKKSIFLTTGAEAVENAVKIARAHTGRPGVIAFQGGFHGRTNLTMGLTGKIAPYKAGFGPFPGEIYHAPYPVAFHGRSEAECLAALESLFHCDIEPSRVAAIIIEPIQGEGGFYIAPPSFMQALRRLCDQHGIVLICDEIQTGFARTGKLFATEFSGIEPDMITLAKGLAGGFPLAAVTGKAEIMDAANPGGLGGTYAGSPLGCVAANAVLEVIEQEQLCHKALAIGEYLTGRLERLKSIYPQWVGEIRVQGAMVAMELVEQGDADKPNPALTKAIIGQAQAHGLVLLACGVRANVIRILAPLTIPQDTLAEGADKLEAIFAAVSAG